MNRAYCEEPTGLFSLKKTAAEKELDFELAF